MKKDTSTTVFHYHASLQICRQRRVLKLTFLVAALHRYSFAFFKRCLLVSLIGYSGSFFIFKPVLGYCVVFFTTCILLFIPHRAFVLQYRTLWHLEPAQLQYASGAFPRLKRCHPFLLLLSQSVSSAFQYCGDLSQQPFRSPARWTTND